MVCACIADINAPPLAPCASSTSVLIILILRIASSVHNPSFMNVIPESSAGKLLAMELEGVEVVMEVLDSGRREEGRESWFSRVERREW